MSRLRVIWPDEADSATVSVPDEAILPLADFRAVRLPVDRSPARIHYPARWTQLRQEWEPVERARILFANRQCPKCQYPVVRPVELDDATIGRSGLPIPGTATLIGFECADCEKTWPAE
jgi:hypothetical protein